jgi:hypothetical protein
MDYGLGEPAPDGNAYVHLMTAPPALLDAYRRLIRCVDLAQTIPGPEGRARADAVGLLLLELEAEVTAAGEAAAVAADDAIKARIQATRLRPPGGRNRLEDAIQSRGIPSVPAGGAVGIADFDFLEKKAVDDHGDPYWRAQELGSDHLVGRKLTGFFMPGQAAPSQAEFRQHPIFQPDPTGTQMLIQRPIPAKHFLQEGVAAADTVRLAEFRQIERRFVTRIGSIMSGTHPFVERARRIARSRTR